MFQLKFLQGKSNLKSNGSGNIRKILMDHPVAVAAQNIGYGPSQRRNDIKGVIWFTDFLPIFQEI